MQTTFVGTYLTENDARRAAANFAVENYAVILVGPTERISASHDHKGVEWPHPGAAGCFLVIATMDHLAKVE